MFGFYDTGAVSRTTEQTPGVTSQAKIMYRPDFVSF